MTLRSLKLALAAVSLAAVAAAGQAEYILKTSPAKLTGVLVRYSLVLDKPLHADSATGLYQVTAPAGLSAEQAAAVAADPDVLGFESDAAVHEEESKPSTVPVVKPSPAALAGALAKRGPVNYYGATVRQAYVDQTATALIRLATALSRFGAGNTVVAVIDTGVDPTHPALKDVLIPGYDFTRNQPGMASELADLTQSTVAILDQSTVAILDRKNTPVVLNQSTVAILDQSTVAILDAAKLPGAFGHGTMTAGLVHLAAPTARIMPLKAFKADGSASLSDIVQAVYFAVDHGARVINMSFSMAASSPQLQAAIAYARVHNVVAVASVGNDGRETEVYPASYSAAVGVASTDAADRRSVFSNYGDAAKLAAPGEAVITTYPGGNYAGVWGTSFSTALVSGGAALLAELRPAASAGKISDALEHGKPIPGQRCGEARLDVLSSLLYLLFN